MNIKDIYIIISMSINKKEVVIIKIGVFDSGIGGASVLKELLKKLPNEEFLYLSDSKNNPYGDKELDELVTICEKNVDYLLQNECKAIVIACNTASVKTAEHLRKKYDNIPIFAIEPAYKMVHDYAYDKPTLVLATKGTIESEEFGSLLKKYDNHQTYLIPCIGLADAIEEGNEDHINDVLNKYIDEYKGRVKNIVLGCTHYPFVTDKITERLGDVQFFYGAEALANHVKTVLTENGMLKESDHENGNIVFVDTSNSEFKKERFWNIMK
ncbi:MAG: glutamate racemase [Clostridia bacterium]|nr:glutamate racemase [Clostridia bacterium]